MAERDRLIDLRQRGPAYDADYAGWLDHQVSLMKAGRWKEIDRANLIDEVESLGRSDFRALVSSFESVVAHMLKWDHQPERRSNSWIGSIAEHRARIDQEFKDSPSYKPRLADAVERSYRPARARASAETGLPLNLFPARCPYTPEEIINRKHLLP